MRPNSRLFLPAAAAAALVLDLAACSSTSSVVATGPALQTYSCCSSRDIDAIRHPGETMNLHWLATPLGPSATSAVSTVRLGAGLSGPFESVSALKSANSPATLTAPVIVTTNQVGDAPISVIVIPKDAAAGYYNLTTTIDQDGGQLTGGSVIKVSTK
ncbi:MAG TPA: hypothetical protein VIJ41_09505 [Candidatus Nanopelagicales bacterium]